MSDFRVDGLVSGLDTTTIIDQLMSIERAPIRRLQRQKATFDAKVNAWDDIQAKLDGVADAIEALRTGAGLSAVAATVSDDSVAATPTGSGAPGIYEFDVVQTASAHQLMSSGFAESSSLVGAGRITLHAGLDSIGIDGVDASNLAAGSYDLTVAAIDGATATIVFGGEEQEVASSGAVTLTAADGSTVEVTLGAALQVGSASLSTAIATATTTLAGLASQLQDSGGPATVHVVDRGGETVDPSVLVITGLNTGEANRIEVDITGLSGIGGAFTDIREPADSIISVGDGGLVIQRETTSITGAVPGVTLDLSTASAGSTVVVGVSRDEEKATELMTTFLDAANAFFEAVGRHGRSTIDPGQAGALSGDSSLRRVTDEVRQALQTVGSGTDIVLATQVGVSTARDGTLEFDAETFGARFADSFSDVEAFLVGDNGLFARITGALKLIEENGPVEAAKARAEFSIEEIDETISAKERRLESTEAGLRRQYSALETLLSQLNSQSNYLASLLGAGQDS